MPPAAISFASTCAPLLAALGVELPRMTGNIVSSSAHDSSTRARLWLRRSSRLPMATHAGAGTTYFVLAGPTWPSSFGACARLPFHRRRRRILRMLKIQLRGLGERGLCFMARVLGTLVLRIGIGLFWVVGSFWGFSPGCSMGLSFLGAMVFFLSFLSFPFRSWGLRSSEPWGCLRFLFLYFFHFSLWTLGQF